MSVHFREEVTLAVDVALLVRSYTPWPMKRYPGETRMHVVRTSTRIGARSAVLAGWEGLAGDNKVVPAAGN